MISASHNFRKYLEKIFGYIGPKMLFLPNGAQFKS